MSSFWTIVFLMCRSQQLQKSCFCESVFPTNLGLSSTYVPLFRKGLFGVSYLFTHEKLTPLRRIVCVNVPLVFSRDLCGFLKRWRQKTSRLSSRTTCAAFVLNSNLDLHTSPSHRSSRAVSMPISKILWTLNSSRNSWRTRRLTIFKWGRFLVPASLERICSCRRNISWRCLTTSLLATWGSKNFCPSFSRLMRIR